MPTSSVRVGYVWVVSFEKKSSVGNARVEIPIRKKLGEKMLDLRPIGVAVVARRPEWQLGEVMTVLHRVLVDREGVTVDRLRNAALTVAATPAARTPWALLASGAQWSEENPGPLPQPPRLLRAVPEGAESDRRATYAVGGAMAREALADAADAREAALEAYVDREAARRVHAAEAEVLDTRSLVDW